MTVQSSRIGSLASSLRGTARTCYRASVDLLVVGVLLFVVAVVALPLVNHIYYYWRDVVVALQPAPQKAASPAPTKARP